MRLTALFWKSRTIKVYFFNLKAIQQFIISQIQIFCIFLPCLFVCQSPAYLSFQVLLLLDQQQLSMCSHHFQTLIPTPTCAPVSYSLIGLLLPHKKVQCSSTEAIVQPHSLTCTVVRQCQLQSIQAVKPACIQNLHFHSVEEQLSTMLNNS